MNQKLAYLKYEMTPEAMAQMDPVEQADLQRFKAQCSQGPADSEMDIEWQETGKGYYAHLFELDRLGRVNPDYCARYRLGLLAEIAAMTPGSAEYSMAQVVRDAL